MTVCELLPALAETARFSLNLQREVQGKARPSELGQLANKHCAAGVAFTHTLLPASGGALFLSFPWNLRHGSNTAQRSAKELWGKTSFPGQECVRSSILFPSISHTSFPQRREVKISQQSHLQNNIQGPAYWLPTCDPSSARTWVNNHKLLEQRGFDEIIKAPFPNSGPVT